MKKKQKESWNFLKILVLLEYENRKVLLNERKNINKKLVKCASKKRKLESSPRRRGSFLPNTTFLKKILENKKGKRLKKIIIKFLNFGQILIEPSKYGKREVSLAERCSSSKMSPSSGSKNKGKSLSECTLDL